MKEVSRAALPLALSVLLGGCQVARPEPMAEPTEPRLHPVDAHTGELPLQHPLPQPGLQDPEVEVTDGGGAGNDDGGDQDSKSVAAASPMFMFHAGVSLLNPFSIQRDDTQENPLRLEDSSEQDTAGYFEWKFKHRRAWLDPDRWFDTGDYFFDDLEARIGFTALGDESNLSSIAGTGDVYGEVSLEWNLFKSWDETRSESGVKSVTGAENWSKESHFSLNFGLLGGFNTDRFQQDVHGMGGAGFIGVWSTPIQVEEGEDPRLIEGDIGIYFGASEFPDVRSDDAGAYVAQNSLGRARFRQADSLQIRADIHFPVGETGYFVFQARVFDELDHGDEVHPWSMMLGYTVPIGQLGSALLSQ